MTPRKLLAGPKLLLGRAGFSATELIVVCSIVGLLTAVSVPFFLSYYQSAYLKAATEELAAFLNQGRQLAIKENQGVCVHTASGQIHFHVGGCAATTWLGPGTDASGNLKMPTGFTLTATADPIFSYLGAASPAATYTLTSTQDGRTLRVIVAASGRITIGP